MARLVQYHSITKQTTYQPCSGILIKRLPVPFQNSQKGDVQLYNDILIKMLLVQSTQKVNLERATVDQSNRSLNPE